MSKKLFSIFLVLTLVFSLAACGKQNADHTESTKEEASANREESKNVPEPSDTNKSDAPKAAVIYFSATGTTKQIAELIADKADADIFEIVPKEAYSSDDLNYHNDNCRANREMNDKSARPEIIGDLRAVSDYDTIYLGYPIWWGTAPRIIQTFLESYDLRDKTVYLFCTSGGSGIEQSVRDLQELYPQLNIVNGKRLNGATKNDIQAWLSELGSSK